MGFALPPMGRRDRFVPLDLGVIVEIGWLHLLWGRDRYDRVRRARSAIEAAGKNIALVALGVNAAVYVYY